MFFLTKYSKSLEEDSFRRRSADFLWMLLFGAGVLVTVAPLVNLQFLGSSLTFMMVYVWGRRHQYVQLSMMGLFNFTAPYLPWVLLAFSVMLGNSPLVDLLGMMAGGERGQERRRGGARLCRGDSLESQGDPCDVRYAMRPVAWSSPPTHPCSKTSCPRWCRARLLLPGGRVPSDVRRTAATAHARDPACPVPCQPGHPCCSGATASSCGRTRGLALDKA